MTAVELSWEQLRERLDQADPSGTAELLTAATEAQRVALARQVEAYAKGAPLERYFLHLRSQGGRSGPVGNPAAALALAAIGCLPSAARVAALLTRRELRDQWYRIPVPLFLDLAAVRGVPWLADLAGRLACKLRFPGMSDDWAFLAALVRAAAAPVPTDAAFVLSWLDDLVRPRHNQRPVPAVERMRDDPFLDSLLPMLFEIDGLGLTLAAGGWDAATKRWNPDPVLPGALATLAEQGRLDRKVLLDGVLSRLLRGDKPGALRAFVLLHEALAPTVDELAERVLDYARLLSDAPSTVATLAQRALRAVDGAGRLELETLLEVSAAALARRERGLVKTQLSWLDRVASRHRDRAGEVIEAVVVAFGHETLDVQERALTVVAKHRAHLDGPTLARLAPAAELLAGDLPGRAAELFGPASAERAAAAGAVVGPGPLGPPYPQRTETFPPAGARAAELPALPAPAPAAMPEPIASPAELAEEIVALIHARETAVGWERILSALVAFAGGDRAVLGEALEPVLDRYAEIFAARTWNYRARFIWLGEAIRTALAPDPDRTGGIWQRMVQQVREAWQGVLGEVPGASVPKGPDGVLALRVAEIAVRLVREPVPFLMATPTSVTGALAAETLLDRIATAEAASWQPWPLDLEQALLRLPRVVDPALAVRAGALRSPAGLRLAAWLTDGGLPDPVATRHEQRARRPRSPGGYHHEPVARRVVVNLAVEGKHRGHLDHRLFTLRRMAVPAAVPAFANDVWAAALPQHRDVVAAWALPGIASLADEDQRGAGELLPLLAECAGPVGPALPIALAYGLGARHEADRVAAVDAFLLLAGAGESFEEAVGRELGDLGADGTVKLSRVVPGLAEAARAGGSAQVWKVITAALPALLPADSRGLSATPRGLPDLLALGAQVAATSGVRGELPEVAAVAAGKGSSRVVTEARRLHRVLTG